LNEIYTLFSKDSDKLLSVTPFLCFSLNKNFSITAGPSITWLEAGNAELQKPIFRIAQNFIDENNSIVIAARAGVRFRL